MSVAGIGNSYAEAVRYQENNQNEEDVIFKTYSYRDGKGQETVYHARDCVQLDLDSYTVPIGSDTYEELRDQIKTQWKNNLSFPGNNMFGETYEVMDDYYSGKLSRDEVKNIFKEYFYHSMGSSSVSGTGLNDSYVKQLAKGRLEGLYEYFSRANTRNACARNQQEGKALMESNGLSWSGTYYYNADWYWQCEDMQELFRETANELADEYGAEHVDFQYVEEHTRFTLDGGITYNGVWDSMEWQINHDRAIGGSMIDKNMEPPRGFVYCSTAYWDGETDLNGIREALEEKRRENTRTLFLLAAGLGVNTKDSLLLDAKNYNASSNWKQDDMYRSAMSFLKNFNINWNFRSNRMEVISMAM
ncbi:MAG: hypothetical protein HDR27_01000 [Lachnospiraceae bacterium]|nr:hypothetical protein [Lachnospiraceae bacterium]